jgi:hypothetical protein
VTRPDAPPARTVLGKWLYVFASPTADDDDSHVYRTITLRRRPRRRSRTRGHKPGTLCVETVWLGVLGPSTTLCWSRLRIASARPGTAVDATDLAVSLGLSAELGRNAPITKTFNRMIMFGVAHRPDDTLAVRRFLPDVPQRMTGRLSYTARLAHQRWAHVDNATTERTLGPGISLSMEITQ